MNVVRRHADLLLTAGLVLLMLGPALLRPGYILVGDMVFVPDQPWKDAWLGLDGSTPRAVPMDALLSLATQVLPGQVWQKVLLALALLLAGTGTARLVGDLPLAARAAAVTLAVWNPWVHERLAIGQWAAVLGYGVLPWLVLAAGRVRDREPGGWPRLLVVLVAAAVCSPSSGLMAVLVAVCVVLPGRRVRDAAALVGAGVLANGPWLAPALVGPAEVLTGDGGFAGFAARAESALGTAASLLSLGGIWKESVVPAERTHAVVVAVSVVVSVCALAGLARLVRADATRWGGLALAGAASLALAGASTLPGAAELLDDAAGHVPGLALLRDSHRFLAPVAVALAVGLAAFVAWLWEVARTPDRGGLGAVAVLVAAAPVLCLPGSAWGHWGDLEPVEFPREWAQVGRELSSADRTVVLPWTGSYRGYAWNDHRAVLDPAPRYFPGEVLTDDRLLLRERTIASEEPLLRRVDAALQGPDPAAGLRALGVRFVLVEHGNGVRPSTVPQGTLRHEGEELTLVDLGRPAHSPIAGPPRGAVAAGNAAAIALLLLAGFLFWRLRMYPERT